MAMALDGPKKAVLFLLSLEEELAAEVARHLDDDELRTIRRELSDLPRLPVDAVEDVLDEFGLRVTRALPSARGGEAYFRRVLERAYGDTRAESVFSDPPQESDSLVPNLEALPSRTTAILVSGEHPQIVAALLATFEPGRAAEVLAEMEPDERSHAMSRLASTTEIPAELVRELAGSLVDDAAATAGAESIQVNGAERVAAILNRTQAAVTEVVLEELAASDTEMAKQVRQAMFRFEDLVGVDKRAMQRLLKEVETSTLLMALKTASEELSSSVFVALSSRAAAMLQEDLEAMGPVRVSDVEDAQQRIVEDALRLQAEGQLALPNLGGDAFV